MLVSSLVALCRELLYHLSRWRLPRIPDALGCGLGNQIKCVVGDNEYQGVYVTAAAVTSAYTGSRVYFL